MAETIKSLQDQITSFRDERNWKQFHKPKDMALSLVLEASELMEHFQWCSEEESRDRLTERKDDLGEELSDVLYWTLLMANDFGIDLEKSFLDKMKKNQDKYPVSQAKNSHAKYSEYSPSPSKQENP